MKNKIFTYIAGICLLSGILVSCEKETTLTPKAEIYRTVENYTVSFIPHVSDATSYLWDFGDGSTSSTELNPVHTYVSFGDYNVKLTVKGEGGEYTAEKVINIEALTVIDKLTGGVQAENGKTWVLSKIYNAGKDGAGPVMAEMPIMRPSIDNVLEMVGLGAEYDNEYTFYFDGRFKTNVKNGSALAGLIYGMATQTLNGSYSEDVGLCQAAYESPAEATFLLKTDVLNILAILDPTTTDVEPPIGNVSFSGKNWVSLSKGAYFGILDFPTLPIPEIPNPPQFIIKEISSDKMNVALFMGTYQYNPNYVALPSMMMHLTFEVKK
jgi:PKD repeat protein